MRRLALTVILLSTITLTGCWNSRELSSMAITVCLGVDKSGDEYLISEQILNTKVIASKKTVDEPAVLLYSQKGKDILENLRRFTTQMDRKIYNAHMRLVVLGEDVAKENINNIIDFLARDHEYRTDFYFIIAKDTTAYDVLRTLTSLEAVPGIQIFQSLQLSEKVWATTKSIRIIELLNDMIADGKEPVIQGVEISGGENTTNTLDELKSSDTKNKLKLSGLGVFKDNKLAGWLDEEESKGYNYIVGNIQGTVGQYGNKNENDKITFEVISSKSKIKAYKENGKIAIRVDIKAEENIGMSDESIDVTKKESVEKLSSMSEERITYFCKKSLEKIQKEFKSDVYGFGEVVHRAYPKEWKNIKGNWNKIFSTIPVTVNVEVKINRLGQIGKSFFIKEKD